MVSVYRKDGEAVEFPAWLPHPDLGQDVEVKNPQRFFAANDPADFGLTGPHQITKPDYDKDTQNLVKQADGDWGVVDVDFETAKQNKLNSIKSRYEQEMAVVRGDATESEIASWDKQELQAREYQVWIDGGEVGAEPSTPFVDDLASARDVTKAWLVGRIIAKADLASTYTATQTGIRQKLEDELDAAQTVADVRAITWPE